MNKPTFIHESAEVFNNKMASGAKIYKNTYVKNCVLGEDAKIGDFGRLENSHFGKMSDIQRFAMIYDSEMGDYSYCGRNFTAWHCKIGKFCSISWNVSIGGANHDYNRVSQHAFLYSPQFQIIDSYKEQKYNRFTDNCEIGNDVWIACNAVICRGVKVGDGAVVAAGAVVTKDVEPYSIVAGVPAKQIKRRCSKELATRLIKSAWWNLPSEIIRKNIDLFNAPINDISVSNIENLVGNMSDCQ